MLRAAILMVQIKSPFSAHEDSQCIRNKSHTSQWKKLSFTIIARWRKPLRHRAYYRSTEFKHTELRNIWHSFVLNKEFQSYTISSEEWSSRRRQSARRWWGLVMWLQIASHVPRSKSHLWLQTGQNKIEDENRPTFWDLISLKLTLMGYWLTSITVVQPRLCTRRWRRETRQWSETYMNRKWKEMWKNSTGW